MPSSIGCNIPILFIHRPMATTIAVMTATNKNIGLVNMVTPSFTKAPPIVPNTPMKLLKLLPISAGLTLPRTWLNTFAFWFASSKSRLMRLSLIPPNELLTCSNLLPDANTLAASLASEILSFSSPALAESSAICCGSVALAMEPFNSRSSSLISLRPCILIGIST